MKHLIIIILMITLFPIVSAVACYQESANQTYTCGGRKFEDYAYLSSPDAESVDENWDSFGLNNGTFAKSYLKPYGSLNTSVWQVKDSGGTVNLTIPSQCWTGISSINAVYFKININTSLGINWSCSDGNNPASYDIQLRYDNTTPAYAYEEAMIWDMQFNLIYQENPDNYSAYGVWVSGGLDTYDGDWGTADTTDWEFSYLDVNYSIPADVESAVWSIKTDVEPVYFSDVNISLSCWNSFLQLRVKNDINNGISLYCKNLTDWEVLEENMATLFLYEEGIYWYTAEISSPSEIQEDIIYDTLSASGTGMAVFIDEIRNPLVTISISLVAVGLLIGIIYMTVVLIKFRIMRT